ncbi:hypothetical protein MYA83_12580 [Pseudomonas palleroniana]|uniref:hypothetical protein n=1 Tax=Pseudomonas palleroniana TaxID=191390 RepID=UPI003B0047B3
MTDNTELKRLADELIAANDLYNESPQDNEVGDAWSLANDRFTEAASPEVILAMIAENDRLKSEAVYSAAGFDAAREEMARLKAEVAGLKTGYEAYERVNAELKAECALSTERKTLQLAEIEALRKRIDDLSPFKGAPLTGPDLKCLACGDYHYGLQGLPCPNMRFTASAAMGKGERP